MVAATIETMDDTRVGRVLRQLRLRKGWRQADVAAKAGVSQSTISLIERGHLDTLSIRTVRLVCHAVDSRFIASVGWRGGLVDRLIDERHARLVGAFARDLAERGWEVHVEVTFSEYGERGSIDILALRRDLGIALVVEIKSELVRVDATVRRLDVKERLAARIVHDRFGWRPRVVARLLVIEEGATARRRVAVHDRVLGVAFPVRGSALRAWVRRPVGRISGLLFSHPPTGVVAGRETRLGRRVVASFEAHLAIRVVPGEVRMRGTRPEPRGLVRGDFEGSSLRIVGDPTIPG